jgi:hypothetical protein
VPRRLYNDVQWQVERVYRMGSERSYANSVFHSAERPTNRSVIYPRWDNSPLLVPGRKSPLQFWKGLAADLLSVI